MPATAPANVVIECPHCGTRYQVTQAAIGAKGRTVQCAHCTKSWLAKAVAPKAERKAEAKPERKPATDYRPDDGVGDALEKELDAKFEAEAARNGKADPGGARSDDHQRAIDDIKAAVGQKAAEKLDPATRKLRLLEFAKRQASLSSTLPMARMRRTARIVVLVLLVALIGGALTFRSPLVQQFPELAGAYAAVGLGVNVIGLDFSNVRTMKSLQHGAEVLVVDGDIRNVTSQSVDVPQIIVTLLGADGIAAYEWGVSADANQLAPGEIVHFETQFTAPPAEAQQVKLTFANGRSQSRSGEAATGPDHTNVPAATPATAPAAGSPAPVPGTPPTTAPGKG